MTTMYWNALYGMGAEMDHLGRELEAEREKSKKLAFMCAKAEGHINRLTDEKDAEIARLRGDLEAAEMRLSIVQGFRETAERENEQLKSSLALLTVTDTAQRRHIWLERIEPASAEREPIPTTDNTQN